MADIESLMSKSWAIRAMDSSTPTLKIDEQDATIKTMSSKHNGKEILFPTIRMIDGELQQLNEKQAKELAIEKNDYVEYDNPEDATAASIELSNFIGFARDPKGTMEREEREYQEHMKNMPFGNVKDFISGLKGYPLKPDEEKGIMYEPLKSKAQILGGDFRSYLQFNRTSIPFMMLYDYFKEEK